MHLTIEVGRRNQSKHYQHAIEMELITNALIRAPLLYRRRVSAKLLDRRSEGSAEDILCKQRR